MTLLIAGLFLWTIVHFIPSIGISIKRALIERIGQMGYTAAFAVLIVLSLILIVFGWRSITPTFLYALPEVIKPVSLLLLVLAFFLFGAAKLPTGIKRVVRHPQLLSVIIWSCAHLFLNGDSRSIILFGWLGIWAVLEMVFINKREGQWVKQDAPSWKQELIWGLISLTIFIVAVLAHPYIAGVSII